MESKETMLNLSQIPDSASMNWTEDYPHENGNYCNTCGSCKRLFLGHKRRIRCRDCSDVVNILDHFKMPFYVDACSENLTVTIRDNDDMELTTLGLVTQLPLGDAIALNEEFSDHIRQARAIVETLNQPMTLLEAEIDHVDVDNEGEMTWVMHSGKRIKAPKGWTGELDSPFAFTVRKVGP